MSDEEGMNLLPIYDPEDQGPMRDPGPTQPSPFADPVKSDAEMRADQRAAEHALEFRIARAGTVPWARAGVGLSWRDGSTWQSVNPRWLGPFGLGDEVSVNGGEVVGVIEYTSQYGMVVVPKAPATRDVQDAGAWVPGIGVRSIAPLCKLDVVRTPYVAPAEPTGIEDASLPMNLPPVQPGAESTFR